MNSKEIELINKPAVIGITIQRLVDDLMKRENESIKQACIEINVDYDVLEKTARHNETLRAALYKAVNERDALIKELHGNCTKCKYWEKDKSKLPCRDCLPYGLFWEWRGLKDEQA